MPAPKTISVSVLGKDYQVSCGPDEVESLRRSAAYLDRQMGEMKAKAGSLGPENLAVMAALNIANDCLALSERAGQQQEQQAQAASLGKKLDQALQRLKKDLD